MTNYYTLRVHNAEIKDLWRKRSLFKGRFTRPSPYVKISVGDLVQRSSIAEKTVIPTWDDELPILCSGSGSKINIEILQDSVLAKGEYLYRPDNESERSEAKLRVDLRSHKDKIIKSSSFIMFGINPSDANGIAELAIKKLIQAVYGNNDEASTVDEMIQRGAAGYQSDLASLFKESTPFVDIFMKNMDELAGAHPYLKLAWNITSVAYKAVHSQIEFDKQVKELIEELVRTFRVIRDAAQIRRPLESFTAATSELLDLVIRLCIFIREYVRRDFIGRTLHVNDRVVITEFKTKLGTLKTNLDEAFSRQNVVISSRAASDALLEKLEHDLNPVYMSGGDRPICLDGTRVNLLQEIERWIHDKDQPNIFLLSGGAGTGKSTVATTIAERYGLRRKLGCHLFFMRGKSDPNSVIRTMAYRLASLSQTIAENIADSVKGYGEIKSATFLSQFKVLLHDPLHSSAQGESDDPILIVLDALDECGTKDSRMTLLQILKKGLPTLPSKYRFLLTSRPEGTIVSFLSLHTIHSVTLDNNTQDSKDDVRVYLSSKLRQFQEDKLLNVPTDWPWEDCTKRLECAAGGLFIWASTAMKFISEKKSNRILYLEELINNAKTLNLSGLYETVLENSLEWDRHTKTIFPRIFSLIFFSKRQLADMEVDGILGLKRGTTNDLLSDIRSLVTFEPGWEIRINHASFYDYLLACEGKDWFIDSNVWKEQIAINCFEQMGNLLRFNICELESSFLSNSDIPDISERVGTNIPSYLRYICCNWIFHLRSVPYSRVLNKYLDVFARSHLLFWFEVLSLTGFFGDYAGFALTCAISWLGDNDPELSEFLRDAYRQASTFSDPISKSTPHIYCSLLPLTMDESIVSKHYQAYASSAIRIDNIGRRNRTGFIRDLSTRRGDFQFVSFSPDGTHFVTGSFEGKIFVWDAASGLRVIGPLEGHSAGVLSVTYSPDGRFIASGSEDRTIRIWDVTSGELVREPLCGHEDDVFAAEFSPDSKLIASGSGDKTIRVWDVESRKLVGEPLLGHIDKVRAISFSPDSLYFASGSNDGTIIVWDIRTMKMKCGPFRGHTGIVRSVAFLPDGKNVLSGSFDGTARIWDISTEESICTFSVGDAKILTSAACSPDGTLILAGSNDGLIQMWDALNPKAPPKQFKRHTYNVASIAFAPDSTRFVSSSFDKSTTIWDVSGGILAGDVQKIQEGPITCLAMAPNGRYIVSGSDDFSVCLWDANNGGPVSGPWKGHTSRVLSVTFSPDASRFASGSNDTTIKLWDVTDGEYASLEGHTHSVMSVVFSPNGEYIASGSKDKTIRVWDTASGKLVGKPFEGHSDWIHAVDYSPDGTKLVSGSRDKTVRIWDTTNGQILSICEGHTDWVYDVAFSPDGTRVVSGSSLVYENRRCGSIIIWDSESGRMVCGPIMGHTVSVISLCYSPDGKRISSGSRDGSICVWDSLSGNPIDTFTGHSKGVTSISFYPDGDRFASCSYDGTIRTWAVVDNPSNSKKWTKRPDGWVVDKNDELLVWFPLDLQDKLLTPGTTSIMNQTSQLKVTFSDHHKGNEWLNNHD